VPQEAFRIVNEQIAGSFVEDAYLYSGAVDIVEIQKPGKYRVIYAPYAGPGGAPPSVPLEGAEQLREFLERKVGIRREVVERALRELADRGNSTIPNVQLRHHELKRLGLV
jgi:hypothetical protein